MQRVISNIERQSSLFLILTHRLITDYLLIYILSFVFVLLGWVSIKSGLIITKSQIRMNQQDISPDKLSTFSEGLVRACAGSFWE